MKVEETEDLVASLAALGIMILPLSEVVLRRFFNTGVPGAAPFTTHLTLVVGLAVAGLRLLQVHREVGREIALGVPIWAADLFFPLAFGLMALRLVWKASPK